MSRLTLLFFAIWLAACGSAPLQETASADKPIRIVSLDFCADNYLLKLADPEQILAISPDGVKDFSYMREAAIGIPTVRPVAENVIILAPDLVVRSYGGGPNAAAFFERAGIPVLQIGWASNIDSEEMDSIPFLINQVSEGLGQKERGAAVISEFRARLGAVKARRSGNTVLYMTPAGVTTGEGSLVHEMLTAAGLVNFEKSRGWRSLPLERLAYEQPDLVAASFFDSLTNHRAAWSASKHPVARAQLTQKDVVPLKGAWTACGGWFIMDAIEALADGVGQ